MAILAPPRRNVVKPKPWWVRRWLVASEWRWAWEGLVSVVLVWEGGGSTLYDVVDRARQFTPSAGSPNWGVGTLGHLQTGDDTLYWETDRDEVVSGSNPRTSLLVYEPDAATDVNDYFFGWGPDVTGEVWRMRHDTNRPRIEVRGGFSIADQSVTGQGVVVYVARCPGDDVANTEHFVDGVNVGVASSGSQAMNTGTDPYVFMGANRDGVEGGPNIDPLDAGDVYMMAHWSRELTDAEIAQLARDPFGPLRQSTSLALAVPTADGGGATTINRTLSDSFTFTDNVERDGIWTRALSDSFTFSDTLSRTRELSRTLLDTLSFSDTLSRAGSVFTRTLSDTFNFSEDLDVSGVGLEEAARAVAKLVRKAHEFITRASDSARDHGDEPASDLDRPTRRERTIRRYDEGSSA